MTDWPPILKRLPNLNVLELQSGLVSKVYGAWTQPNLSLTTLVPRRPHAIVGEPVQSGAFGAVYRVGYDKLRNEVEESQGHKSEINTEFAAKVVWKNRSIDGEMMDQDQKDDMKVKVLQEAKNLMEMSREHRHILTCYGVSENNEYWVLVTEYAQLGDLYDYYDCRNDPAHRSHLFGSLMPQHFRQVSKAIAFLHHKGFIHRDIKLENFFLCLRGNPPKEVVVLGDLAFLVKMKNGGAEGEYGSPNYAAPEMLLHADKPYTEAVDMWSLGANMYIFPSENFLYNHVAIELGEDPDTYAPQEAAREIVESHKKSNNGSKGLIDVLLSKDPEGPSWVKEMTPEAIDFMRKCLEPDPIKRMSAKKALDHPVTSQSHSYDSEKEGIGWDYDAKKEFKRLAKVVADPEIREKLRSQSSQPGSRQQSHGSTSNRTDHQREGQPKDVAVGHHAPSQTSTSRTQSRVPSKSEAHATANGSGVGKDQTTPTDRTTSRVLSEAKEHRTKSGLSTGKDQTGPTARTPTRVLSEARANRTESGASARQDKTAPAARTSSRAQSEAKENTTIRRPSPKKGQTGQIHHRVASSSTPNPGPRSESAKKREEATRSRNNSQVVE
ncbi:kinase-like protein [Fomitiporia mediterranea MF3/22]|uniref:kinase-like protein n=1 Tax=Fomitiporia mediterranea (strain MF3/22) TaxID=694068 RepID=UPI0004408308|nr:kinase-like protein [Fomitiporia mediterranea MF3/22]EJC99933.1 kinase-like protein [Fomitiporia mediterranea MF3/22]